MKIKEIMGKLFQNQDSKYFLKNAFAITAIPLICFAVTFYSLWIFLEMNYSFFASNGFISGPEFKSALLDQLMSNVNSFIPYFIGFFMAMFMVGLMISYFVMRPFQKIAAYFNNVEDIYTEDLKFDGMSQKKLIVQSAMALVEYLRDPQAAPEDIASKQWFNHKKPASDFVFYFQYFCIISIIMLITAGSVYLLTNELHESIVENALSILKSNKAVSIFFEEQKSVLVNIYMTSILINVALYALLAKKVIEQVDGVSFGFYRDIKQIVGGDHKKKLFPRFSDPGKDAANSINGYLDFYFKEYQESNPESVIAPPKPVDNVHELKAKLPIEKPVEHPPVFIDEKKVVGGASVFNIITPKGYKVENLGEGELIKVLKELELKDK